VNDFEEPPRLLGIIRRYRKYPNSASGSSKCSGMAHFSSSRLGIIQGPRERAKPNAEIFIVFHIIPGKIFCLANARGCGVKSSN